MRWTLTTAAVAVFVALVYAQDAGKERAKKPDPKQIAIGHVDKGKEAIAADKIEDAISHLQRAIGELQKLIVKGLEGFLPKAPDGWTREKPTTQSGNWGAGADVMQWNQLTCRYTNPDGRTVELTLSNSPQMLQGTREMAKVYADPNMLRMMNQNPDVQFETIKADDWMGWIQAEKGGSTHLMAMSAKVMLSLQTEGGDAKLLKGLWDAFPRKECAAANK